MYRVVDYLIAHHAEQGPPGAPSVRLEGLDTRGQGSALSSAPVLLRALGVSGRIKSPTYAVVEPHEGAPAPGENVPLPIWHFDFYRFNDPREWEDAGFRDLFAGPGLKLAEWPDQAAGLLPTPDLTLNFTVMPDETREVTICAHTVVGQGLIAP
jgi:tRNA threonylcarbamoyladenosine biosynthesis protein TsaE